MPCTLGVSLHSQSASGLNLIPQFNSSDDQGFLFKIIFSPFPRRKLIEKKSGELVQFVRKKINK